MCYTHSNNNARGNINMDVGRKLGNYLLISFLGQGGFGNVYLGQHKILQTYAAIKVMHNNLSPTELQNFVQEARIIANLKHPSIVRILDFDVVGTTPFLVMDYAPHGTLRQRHPRGYQIPFTTVVSYVNQVAAALQYAHDHKLIHRDVKPENMLIGPNNEIVLSDFGIAVVAHSTNSRKVEDIIGTWTYAAPELFRGTLYPATDQYALAIVAYEWICGTPPFHGDLPALYHQHMNVPVPSLQQKMPTIPSNVEQVIMTALAKDSHQRFADIQEFANALMAASQLATIPTLSTSPVVRNISSVPMNTSVQVTKVIACSRCGSPTSANSTICINCGMSFVANVSEAVRERTTPLPPSSIGMILLTYGGHSDAVSGVAWSPDGRFLASASHDKTLQVWEASNGKLWLTYGGHSDAVRSVAWSPDGRFLASASDDKTVQIWEVSNGKRWKTYSGHSCGLWAVAWSPDGRFLASASRNNTVHVQDASYGALLLTYHGHSDYVVDISWSPDGYFLASASDDKTVQIWEASTGNCRLTYGGHLSRVCAVTWSPDRRFLASVGYDGTMQVWSSSDGQCWLIYDSHSRCVRAVAWSPDGHFLASVGEYGITQVWEASTGKLWLTYSGLYDVSSIAWSPDGHFLALASYDTIVEVWQVV